MSLDEFQHQFELASEAIRTAKTQDEKLRGQALIYLAELKGLVESKQLTTEQAIPYLKSLVATVVIADAREESAAKEAVG
jgi:hypothetical protein